MVLSGVGIKVIPQRRNRVDARALPPARAGRLSRRNSAAFFRARPARKGGFRAGSITIGARRIGGARRRSSLSRQEPHWFPVNASESSGHSSAAFFFS